MPTTPSAKLVSRLNQPLQGTAFGVDFNPTVDRLRIVSDTGQNLRVNVDDGTTNVDGTLNIPGTTPVNPALGVTAVAYTNNDADPNTATTLFDIDTTNDNIVIQAPANAGSLSPTGKLGVDAAGAGRLRHLQPARLRHHHRPAGAGDVRRPRRADEPVRRGPAQRTGRARRHVQGPGRRHRHPDRPALNPAPGRGSSRIPRRIPPSCEVVGG